MRDLSGKNNDPRARTTERERRTVQMNERTKECRKEWCTKKKINVKRLTAQRSATRMAAVWPVAG